jgi:hypothetical protein
MAAKYHLSFLAQPKLSRPVRTNAAGSFTFGILCSKQQCSARSAKQI